MLKEVREHPSRAVASSVNSGSVRSLYLDFGARNIGNRSVWERKRTRCYGESSRFSFRGLPGQSETLRLLPRRDRRLIHGKEGFPMRKCRLSSRH